MKKLVYTIVFIVALATLASCGSKKGCGLTSDNQSPEPDTELVGDAE